MRKRIIYLKTNKKVLLNTSTGDIKKLEDLPLKDFHIKYVDHSIEKDYFLNKTQKIKKDKTKL